MIPIGTILVLLLFGIPEWFNCQGILDSSQLLQNLQLFPKWKMLLQAKPLSSAQPYQTQRICIYRHSLDSHAGLI